MSDNEKVEIGGLHIYKDKKGRTVYYDPFSKNGYVITKKEESTYSLYSLRFLGAILVGYLSALFTNSSLGGLAVGISTYVAITWVFYVRFLKTLTIIPDFQKPEKESYIERTAKTMPKKKLYMVLFLAISLPIVIGVNIYLSQYTGITLYLNVLLAVIAAGFALVHVLVLLKKKKENIEI